MEAPQARSEATLGVCYALLAYTSWGVVPVYWKQLLAVSGAEILAHRVLWTLLLTLGLLAVTGRLAELRAALRSGPRLRTLALSAALIGGNWAVFLWAMLNEQLLAASLGYYLSPLANVLLGRVFLGERLRRPAWIAVWLAVAGVVLLAVGSGGIPVVSLFLAITFAFYGLLRKLAPVRALAGLAVETAVLAPIAVAYLLLAGSPGFVGFDRLTLLLIGGGAVTALPLVSFAAAARRLWLSTLGLFQYIGPSLTFLLAVGFYREPFDAGHGLAFLLIWTALALYTADALRRPPRPAPA